MTMHTTIEAEAEMTIRKNYDPTGHAPKHRAEGHDTHIKIQTRTRIKVGA